MLTMAFAVNVAAKAYIYQHRYPAGNSQEASIPNSPMLALKFMAGLPPIISMYMLLDKGVLAISSQTTTLGPAKVVCLEWDLCRKFSLSILPLIVSINYLEKPAVKLLNCW